MIIRRRLITSTTIQAVITLSLCWIMLLIPSTTTLAQQEDVVQDESTITNNNNIPIDQFYQLAMEGRVTGDQLWWMNIGEADFPDELLFVVDDIHSPLKSQCGNSHEALPLIGYYRPGSVERWCLYATGEINSFMSRRYLRVKNVAPAPTLPQLVDKIDKLGPEATCVPPAHRDILFEAMELLCFAMGYKPAVIRQRQIHNPQGSSHVALVVSQDVPATLFVPHVRTLLKWLLKQPTVWRGVSRVHWDIEDAGLSGIIDQPFEHSIILAHNEELGNHLVELKVQDASVPGQPSIEATAQYIAHVGAMLGYSRAEVQVYLETSGVVPPTDNEEERQLMFTRALVEAFENCDSGNNEHEMVCRQKQLSYPELPGFRDVFLQSPEAIVTPKIFYQLVEPIDELFLL